jgi:hypothetical protein
MIWRMYFAFDAKYLLYFMGNCKAISDYLTFLKVLTMKRFVTFGLFAVILAGFVLICSSCSRVIVHPSGHKKVGHGPPSHAPAHGYRRKNHHGVEMTYDSGCGVYVVVGFTNHYFFEGHYYRFGHDGWQVSLNVNSGWKAAGEESLPHGLRGKHKGKHAKKTHPGRGRGMKKNDW